MITTSIVILNYNGEKHLKEFLPLLSKYSGSNEIVVADNASTDGSLDLLSKQFSRIRTILFDTNYGFAGGYNVALKNIKSDYYAIINSDVEVTQGWLDPLVGFLERNPDFAACQPKIKSYNSKKQFEYAGACGGYLDRLGYPYCRGRIFEEMEEDVGQYDSIEEVFWSSGACMLIRSADFHEVSGFDEDFFAHMEEIDLCWRLQGLKRKIAVIPESVVYHVGGGTLSKSNPWKTYLNFRNGLSLLLKNLQWFELWKIPLRMSLDLIAGVKFWMENDFSHFSAILRAHLHFIWNIPRDFKKRGKINHSPVRSSITYSRLIIWDRFVKGFKKFSELNQ